jgi:CRP/FNR family transcriptional regulator, cyclic AMP receptor protein
VLFHEGDPGQEMYVIQSGRVELTRAIGNEQKTLAVLTTGEFFGEMALINHRPRSATATVLEDSQLLVLDKPTFEKMIQSNTGIAVRLIQKLAARLEQANLQISVLLLKDANHKVVHLLMRLAEAQGVPEATGVRLDLSSREIADRIGCADAEVEDVIASLAKAQLLQPLKHGMLIPEVGRLQEFLDFLEMRHRFASDD